jgi:hypothetical protein
MSGISNKVVIIFPLKYNNSTTQTCLTVWATGYKPSLLTYSEKIENIITSYKFGLS